MTEMTIQLEQKQEVVLVNEARHSASWTDDVQVINAHFCLFHISYICMHQVYSVFW